MSKLMSKLTKWVDPILEKYREKEPEKELPPYIPTSVEDLVGIISRTPKEYLSGKQRATIAASMSFNERRVSDVMTPRRDITFVYEHDFLGPLMLDKLYQSGMSHFPVLSSDDHQIVGLIHTDHLNSLEIKDTDRASKYIDPKVYYLRSDYSLEQALAAFMRTNCFFFLVIDKNGKLVGLLTFPDLIACLIGYIPKEKDHFDEDSSIAAVMKRAL